MPALIVRIALVAALLGSMVAPAAAGTTGGIRGRVVDADTGAPIAGAKVTVASPSQTAAVNSDAGGTFVFISLSPDTYTIAASAAGYDDATSAGISVLSDQVQNLGSLSLHKRLKTIGRVNARSSSDVVRPGTTSDVYSVNAAGQKAAATAGGPGGLNQAYSAIATVPGANLPQGQQGWNQLVYIRGGDYSDVANELDGVPVQRASDSAPVSTLSSLGQQEVQTYTGGTPPSAEASGLSGYINQVIKTGTYPGYLNLSLGVGGPAFYHLSTFELSGATKNRLFSYYVGLSGVNQSYRYANQNNGAGIPLLLRAAEHPDEQRRRLRRQRSGAIFARPELRDREHLGPRERRQPSLRHPAPHGRRQGRRAVPVRHERDLRELLLVVAGPGRHGPHLAGVRLVSHLHRRQRLQRCGLRAAELEGHRQLLSAVEHPAARLPRPAAPRPCATATTTASAIEKLQYQRNFSSRSFLRLFGYSEYTNWFINGPVSAYFNYSGELDDYEVHGNTFGVTGLYSSQLGDKNLLTATASYQTQKLLTYSGNTFGIATTNLVDKNGNCYNFVYGNYASCFISEWAPGGSSSSSSSGGPVPNPNGGLNQYTQYGVPFRGSRPLRRSCRATRRRAHPAANNGARWLVTENGYNAQIDSITPFFTAASVADQWRPNDKTTINLGLRPKTTSTGSTTPSAVTRRARSGSPPTIASIATRRVRRVPSSTRDDQRDHLYGVNPTNGASLPCATGSHTNLAQHESRARSTSSCGSRASALPTR